MKPQEIRDLTNEELEQRIDETYQESLNLRIRQGAGQIENPLRIRELRRDIARLKTILNERGRDIE